MSAVAIVISGADPPPVAGFIRVGEQSFSIKSVASSHQPSIVLPGVSSGWCGSQAWEYALTRAARGRGKYYPLPYSLDTSKTTADIDAKLSGPYSASI